MEVSVSFTGGEEDLNDAAAGGSAERYSRGRPYSIEDSPLGRVWIPGEGLILTPPVRIRYEKHPWMEKFELDGIKPAPARRKGIGTKGAKGFVKSLATIYSAAYDDYREFGGDDAFDAAGYFRHAAEHFARMAEVPGREKMFSKFCGFAENMWREGDQQMLDVCMNEVIPALGKTVYAQRAFGDNITDEFREYLEGRGSYGT